MSRFENGALNLSPDGRREATYMSRREEDRKEFGLSEADYLLLEEHIKTEFPKAGTRYLSLSDEHYAALQHGFTLQQLLSDANLDEVTPPQAGQAGQ